MSFFIISFFRGNLKFICYFFKENEHSFFPNNMHQMTTTSEVSFCYFLFMVPYFLVRLVIFNWALFGAPDHLFVGFPDGLR